MDLNHKPSTSLKNSILSLEEVKIVVNRALGSQTKVIDFQVKAYSEEKLGFLGAHNHLVVTVEQSSEKETRKFFIKSVPDDVKEQTSVIEESKMFFKEVNFYQLIAPELLNNIVDKSWVAECYLIKKNAMVFEDLKSRNFTHGSKILDTSALRSALTGLAKLHASSILSEKKLGKSFIEMYPEILEESIFNVQSKFGEWYRTGIDVVISVAKSLNLDTQNIPGIWERVIELVSTSKTRQNVVCHGDAWSNNLMFNDKHTCVMVDYQQVRYAPAMTDVSQLIYLTTKRKYRDQHESELLKYYYEVFCKTLSDNNLQIDVKDIKEVKQEYEETRLVGIVTAALYFPLNQMDGKLCVEMTKDSNGFSKLFFQDRAGFVLGLMNKDPNYKDRIVDVVTEMVERSEQLIRFY